VTVVAAKTRLVKTDRIVRVLENLTIEMMHLGLLICCSRSEKTTKLLELLPKDLLSPIAKISENKP
jgi:hypothetical protein